MKHETGAEDGESKSGVVQESIKKVREKGRPGRKVKYSRVNPAFIVVRVSIKGQRVVARGKESCERLGAYA